MNIWTPGDSPLAGLGLKPGVRYSGEEIALAYLNRPVYRSLADMPTVAPADAIASFLKPKVVLRQLGDGAVVEVRRGSRKHNGQKVEKKLRLGPNEVYAFISHPDGSITELGVSKNLLTNIGRDWWADSFGSKAPAGGQGSPATASGATSLTSTGTPWTASALGTPQLGIAGKLIFVPITSITTTPVFGIVVSNTTSVATVDKWWTPDYAGTGTTPSSTAAFLVLAMGGSPIFMALTANASAAAAASTTLTSEITTNGLARAKATYAHTYGNATATHIVAYSATGTQAAIHRMALAVSSALAGADPIIFEAVLSADASVANGDTLTVTDTITYSG